MDLTSMMTPSSQILVVILFVLTMMLRGSKHIPNWVIQWIVLGVALVLSYIQLNAININTIMNAFLAAGVCLFGENAIFRKAGEKTKEDGDILKLVDSYKCEMKSKDKIELSEDDIKIIVQKAIESKEKEIIEKIEKDIDLENKSYDNSDKSL